MDKIYTELFQLFEQKRIELNLTQEDLSKLADISRPTYVNLKNGRRTPQLNSINNICEALKLDIGVVMKSIKNKTMEKESSFAEEPMVSYGESNMILQNLLNCHAENARLRLEIKELKKLQSN